MHDLEVVLTELVTATAPALLACHGVGVDTAASSTAIPARPATPSSSPTPATRYGRTPPGSPAINDTSSRGSPRPTRTVARLSPQRRAPLRVRGQRRRRQTRARPLDPMGPSIAHPRVRATPTPHRRPPRRDRRRARPASPKASSNRPTRRSGYSRVSRSGSTDPNPSSRSQCSRSAHTHPNFPADNDPQKRQESPITAALRSHSGARSERM